ncbi:CLUMA_CG013293, isoform A [Clunio marinus]|uniref:CLUMA_CG013293, isoform A n=1 Tax=Clunio marinus TaxID=568069 RepID=A0A1J1IIF5_9DIPT|nr:CLUMA_CG013293, isoform A [Clunio marinus]
MNHSTNDIGETLLKDDFSVDSRLMNCSRENCFSDENLKFDESMISQEHIYENISLKAEKKHRSWSSFVNKYRRKLKSKTDQLDQQVNYNTWLSADSQNLGEEDDEYNSSCSLSQCQEENIYENLTFENKGDLNSHYDDDDDDDDDEIFETNSVSYWLEALLNNTEDYESDEVMITKCIPSQHETVRCYQSTNLHSDFFKLIQSRFVTYSDLDRYKLEILSKCFDAIWNRDSENEILSGLYIFLNDIFSAYFRKSSTYKMNEPHVSHSKEKSIIRQQNNNENSYSTTVCKANDNRTFQKLETFILSVTLNRLTITYNESIKSFFALENSQAFQRYNEDILIFCRSLASNRRKFPHSENAASLGLQKTLEVILCNNKFSDKYRRNKKKAIESNEKTFLNDINQVVEQTNTLEENIYQPIWKWRTDCNNISTRDEIYASLESIKSDYEGWEVDSEFSFISSKHQSLVELDKNMYKSVCILYSEENPELNKIIYDYKSEIKSETVAPTKNETEVLDSTPTETKYQSKEFNFNNEFNSVKDWITLLKHPNYIDDEESMIMSETELTFGKLVHAEYKDSNKSLDSLESKDESPPKSKIISMSNGSYELNTKETATDKPIPGNYRNINEGETSIPESSEQIEEPKKEREGFRNKLRKFKLKSSKTPSPSRNLKVNNQDTPKESDDESFGPDLETVEKDSKSKVIPRIVVECVQILENDINLKTPGLYRVSGNKTVIEALKKKMNDKKLSKKESMTSLLKNQDVHSIAGVLKMFFRELTPPLMSPQVFRSCTNGNVTLDQICLYLKEMPACNYETLKYLMAHLKKVEQFSEDNLMNSGNIAICWGLCIFSSSFDPSNSDFFENDISKCNMLCKKMIDFYDTIFKE